MNVHSPTATPRLRATALGLATVALATLAVLAMVLPAGEASASERTLASVRGEVEIGSGDPPAYRVAQVGDTLLPGHVLRTGADGRVEIQLRTGTVRLYENSILRLPVEAASSDGSERVNLRRGQSLFDVLRREADDRFEVETPDAVIMVKGTRFSVGVEGSRRAVAVFRGAVGVRPAADALADEILVRPGFAAVGGAGAPFELVDHPIDDPWDSWSGDASAPASPAPPASPPPASAAVDQALEAALAEARPEVVRLALEARPELAQELEQRSEETSQIDVLDAAAADSVDDIQEEFVESVVDGSTGGNTGLEIEVVKSGGPNYVVLTGPGINDVLTNDDLDTILDTGSTALYSPALLNLLNTQGVDPLQFADMLDDMI